MGAPASQVVTQDVDPWIKSRMESLYGDANTYLNNTPYQPWEGARMAEMQPFQQAAAQYLSQGLLGQNLGFSTPQTYGPFGYQPMSMANPDYNPGGYYPPVPQDPNAGNGGTGNPGTGEGGTTGGEGGNPPGVKAYTTGSPNLMGYTGLPVATMPPPPGTPAVPPVASWNGAIQPIGPGTPGSSGGTYAGGIGQMSGQAEGLAAAQGAANAMGYNPAMVNPAMAGAYGNINAQNVAGQGGYQGINNYTNPWQEQVINNTIGDMGRAEAMFREGGIYSKPAGTYGGDRMGVQVGEANRNFLDRVGNVTSQLRSQGFNTAAANAQQDASRYLQAGGLNQAAGLQAGMANQGAYDAMSRYNAGLGMQGQLANQAAGLQGAGLNLSAAGALSGIGSQNLNNLLTGTNALYGMGQMGQDYAQGLINADIRSYDEARNDPLRRFGLLQSVISGMPVGMNTTMTQQPNTFSQIGGLGLGLLGAAGTAGGFGKLFG